MRGLAVALLASLGACVTGSEPVVEPAQEPAQEHVAEPPDRAAAPESSVELPPISEILYEHHVASSGGLELESAGAMFPALTIYTDGSVLRADWQQGGSELRVARLSTAQLEQLRGLLLALAPFERIEQYEIGCPRPPRGPMDVVGTACYVDEGHKIRVGEGEWVCVTGCPVDPPDMLATFIAIEDLLAEVAELESTEWTPTRGHIAVQTFEKTPGPVAWAATPRPEAPLAWAVEGDEFVAAWEEAGRRTGRVERNVDGWRYYITVVPWRPGEDLHDRIARYNEFRLVQVCDGLRTFPMRWEERERWRREQGR